MSHFLKIAHDDNQQPYEADLMLCSATASAALTKARPAGRSFRASHHTNTKWFDRFVKHTGINASELIFKRGLVHKNRWYVACVY